MCKSGEVFIWCAYIVYVHLSVHEHEDVYVCLTCALYICIYIVLVHTWNSLLHVA